jgi:hypothetical protein
MILGHVLERLGDESFAAEALVAMDDLPLMVAVQAIGERLGESASAYAMGAVRRFSAFADDEDWLALMTVLDRAGDPGAACLRQMLAWSLRHDCECERN